MKLNKLFIGAIAALASAAMVACSDDAPDVNNDNGEGFIAVSIIQPSGTSSRATGDFEYGTEAENKASTGTFYVYNEDGTTLISSSTVPLTVESANTSVENTPDGNIEKTYKALIVINGHQTDPSPLKIVCVLNAPAISDATTIAKLQEEIGKYDSSNDGTFVMTSSVYGENTLAVSVNKAYTSASEALDNPVMIHVERVLAKIKISNPTEMTNSGAEVDIDGDGTKEKLTINIKGITIANKAQNAYLFKNLQTSPEPWMIGEYRSYWETTPTAPGYDNSAYTEITNRTGFTDYILPNTGNQKTSVLLTAQIAKEDGTTPDIAYIAGGYTTKQKAMGVIVANLNQHSTYSGYYTKDGNTLTSITTADLEWKDAVAEDITITSPIKSYQVVAQIKSTITTLYDADGNEINNAITNVNSFLANTLALRARIYTEGMCYYFVNIDQSPVADAPAHTWDGVVRNHIYDLTLNSIKGLGVPVFDPNKTIIPEQPKDEKLFYVAAQVRVLSWRLVSQDVNFGE